MTTAPPVTTPLTRLFEFLLYLGFSAEHLPASAELRFENLLVVLDEETADMPDGDAPREARYVAQLFFTEDVLQGPELPELKGELDRSSTLQFLVNLPIYLQDLPLQRQLEAYQLLMLCSQIIPLGYFGLNQEGQVYLSYALKAESQDIQVPLIVEILELLSFFIHRLMPWVETLAGSETPLPELITGLEKSLALFAQPG